jgi:DNA-binding response OmpR family regulator
MNQSILVVEDDQGIQDFLKDFLLDNGFSVRTASDGAEALKQFEEIEPDLVILDLGLPNMSGETVCATIKKKNPSLPIIILTARDSSASVIQGFNLGADDYITKPFIADELLARIHARLKNQNGEATLAVDDLILNRSTLDVTRSEKPIHLTPKEFKLLEYLMTNKGRILTREMILNRVWLYAPNVETRVVDVYIGYLKKKVDEGAKNPLIKSVRGFGYTIKE